MLHMPRQLSCRDMCKHVIWLNTHNKDYNKKNLQLWGHETFVKQVSDGIWSAEIKYQ